MFRAGENYTSPAISFVIRTDHHICIRHKWNLSLRTTNVNDPCDMYNTAVALGMRECIDSFCCGRSSHSYVWKNSYKIPLVHSANANNDCESQMQLADQCRLVFPQCSVCYSASALRDFPSDKKFAFGSITTYSNSFCNVHSSHSEERNHSYT